MIALDHLTKMVFEAKVKDSSVPRYAIPRTKFKEGTANELTKSIIAFLSIHGFAARINTQGNYSEKLGKWIKSGSTNGISDVIAVVNGQFLSVEVKVCRDRMSKAQVRVKDQVQKAGGLYFEARNFHSFFEWFNQKFPNKKAPTANRGKVLPATATKTHE